MSLEVIIVQHAEKEPLPGDPGLTPLGHDQARQCGVWLRSAGPVDELQSSPLRRAVETASHFAAALGLPGTAIRQDTRIRERINWPGEPQQSREAFQRDWERSIADRHFQPAFGDSSRAAGDRFAAYLTELHGRLPHGRVIVVAHGGATVDLVRTWFGDEHVRRLAPSVFEHGISPCGITQIALGGDRRGLRGIGESASALWLDHHSADGGWAVDRSAWGPVWSRCAREDTSGGGVSPGRPLGVCRFNAGSRHVLRQGMTTFMQSLPRIDSRTRARTGRAGIPRPAQRRRLRLSVTTTTTGACHHP